MASIPSIKDGKTKWKKAAFKFAAVKSVGRRRPHAQKSDGVKSRDGTTRGGGTAGRGTLGAGSQMFRDTASIHTSGSTIVREMYQPQYGYDTKTMQRFREYLKTTDLENMFKNLLTTLLNRAELPYNPYPGFADRIYPYAERFHLFQVPDEKIEHVLRNSLKETAVGHLYTVRNFETVWGLSSILRVVSAQRLIRYKWVIDDLTIDPSKLSLQEGYSADVILSLVGPCIFEGTFYSQSYNLQIRKEYVLYGPDSAEGIKEFVNCVEVDINEIYSSKSHQILGVHVFASDEERGDRLEFWSPDRIEQDQETFLKHLNDTVQGNQFIKLECVFLLDPSYPKYVRGQIQYGLNFVTVEGSQSGGDQVSSFCEFPMATLHEGVFLKKSHGEAYMALYKPWLAGFQKERRQKNDLFYIKGTQQGGSGKDNEFEIEEEATMTREYMHDRFDPIKPRRVQIDGFDAVRNVEDSPYASHIMTPLKSMLEMRAARESVKIATIFDACYTSILLLLLKNRSASDKKLEMDIYRVLHGTAGRVYELMEQNKSIRYVVKGFANTKEVGIIREHLVTYRDSIRSLFDSSLNVRSSDYVTVGRALAAQVEDLMPGQKDTFVSIPHIEMALQKLSSLNWYCVGLLIQVVGFTLPELPSLRTHIENLRLEAEAQTGTRYRERPDALGKNIDLKDVTHGQESERIQNHEYYVIDVLANMEENLSVSKLIARDSVLLKYVVDTHLDQIWHDFLINISTEDHFPPNPYPHFVSILRKSAFKMDLFFEKTGIIEERMWSAENMKPEDWDTYVFHIPGVDCHGCPTALILLDTGMYVPLSEIAKKFQQTKFTVSKGPYRVAICMALCGPCIFYGKMQPYLNEIELHEHIYVQGPPRNQRKAIQLFVSIVYAHVLQLINEGQFPVSGLYLGDGQIRWSWEDLRDRKSEFEEDCQYVCYNKGAIVLKAFALMDKWRYVPVQKFFLLHYLCDDSPDGELFYVERPLDFYQSIFLEKDRAAFHYQNGGTKNGGDPLSGPNVRTAQRSLEEILVNSRRRCDWLTVHRALLLRSLLNENRKHIAETWRMLNSRAGEIEYLTFMIDSLQDLVQIMMEHIEKNKRKLSEKATKNKKKAKDYKAELEGPIKEEILCKMFMVFHEKLLNVCHSHIAMARKHLAAAIEEKIQSVIEEDKVLDNYYLAYEPETLFRLEEVKHMLQFIQDTVAGDVHAVCPHANGVLGALQTNMNKSKQRRASVSSITLSDPMFYARTMRRQPMDKVWFDG